MVTVIVIAHDTFGEALEKMAHHFFDDTLSHQFIINCFKKDSPEAIAHKFEEILGKIPPEQSTLVLADFFGATPCNALSRASHKKHISIVTGLNAPMLIKALQDAPKYDNAALLAEEVAKAAHSGIITYDLQ